MYMSNYEGSSLFITVCLSYILASAQQNMSVLKCANAKMEKQPLNLDRPVVFFVVLKCSCSGKVVNSVELQKTFLDDST